mgnify:CR=1 FL=1
MSSTIIELGALELGVAAALVVLLALLTWYMRLQVAGRLLVAGLRTVCLLYTSPSPRD